MAMIPTDLTELRKAFLRPRVKTVTLQLRGKAE